MSRRHKSCFNKKVLKFFHFSQRTRCDVENFQPSKELGWDSNPVSSDYPSRNRTGNFLQFKLMNEEFAKSTISVDLRASISTILTVCILQLYIILEKNLTEVKRMKERKGRRERERGRGEREREREREERERERERERGDIHSVLTYWSIKLNIDESNHDKLRCQGRKTKSIHLLVFQDY